MQRGVIWARAQWRVYVGLLQMFEFNFLNYSLLDNLRHVHGILDLKLYLMRPDHLEVPLRRSLHLPSEYLRRRSRCKMPE